ncbi:MAG: hypothetical protein ACKO2Z_16170, partial [Sphaerospermopsis kisseleviana]
MVNLEQSLISQEQELLNPPSDGPIPEVALYRALRMAELAILGELEKLNSSHNLTGLQLEYQAVEISDIVSEEEVKSYYEEAQLYRVGIGQSLINSANGANISNVLREDFGGLLIERLYEYINQTILSVIPPKKMYLRLLINFSYPQFRLTESDNFLRREFRSNFSNTEITNTDTLSFELS